ncbi:hypothetical protein PFISCL1PPCAC_23240, partial [Pristionchus fissidentatus]
YLRYSNRRCSCGQSLFLRMSEYGGSPAHENLYKESDCADVVCPHRRNTQPMADPCSDTEYNIRPAIRHERTEIRLLRVQGHKERPYYAAGDCRGTPSFA